MPALYPNAQPYTAQMQLDDLVYGASDYAPPTTYVPGSTYSPQPVGQQPAATQPPQPVATDPAAQYPPTSPPPADANYVAQPAPAAGPDPFAAPEPQDGAAPYATEPAGGNDSVSPVPSGQGYGTAFYVNDPNAGTPWDPTYHPNSWEATADRSRSPISPADYRDPFGSSRDPQGVTRGQSLPFTTNAPATSPRYPPTAPPPLPKPGLAGGLSSPYAGEYPPVATTADPNANVGAGESVTDMIGRSFGLNPKDPDTDMYNQAWNNLSAGGGNLLGLGTLGALDLGQRFIGDQARWQRDRAADLLQGGGLIEEQLRWQADMANRLIRSGDDLWRFGEDVVGPAGNTLRQVQSTADPWGEAIAEHVIDPLSDATGWTAPDWGDLSSDAIDFFNRGGERVQNLTEGATSPGDTLYDAFGVPLPTFGLPTPQTRDIDLTHPDWTWGLTPGAVARAAGYELGQAGRELWDQNGEAAAQRARGAAIASRAQGGSPSDALDAAAQSLVRSAQAAFPGTAVDAGSVRDMLITPRSPISDQGLPFLQERHGGRSAGVSGTVRTSGAQLGEAQQTWWRQAIDAVTGILPGRNDPAGPSIGAGTAPLTLRRTAPVGPAVDPNALVMPPGPETTLIDQARGVAGKAGQWLADRAPDADLPGVTLPSGIVLPRGVSLPDMPWQDKGSPDAATASRNAATWAQNAVRGWEQEARNRPAPRIFPSRPAFILEADGSLVAGERTSDAFAAGTGLTDYPAVGVLSVEPDGSIALNSTMIPPASLTAAAARGEYVAALSDGEFDAILAAGLMRNTDGSPLTAEQAAFWRANMVGVPMLAPASWAPYIAGIPGTNVTADDVTYTPADQPAAAVANTPSANGWTGEYALGGNGGSGYSSSGYRSGGGYSGGSSGGRSSAGYGGGAWYDEGGSYPPTMPAGMADFFGPDAFDSPIFDRVRGLMGSRRRGRRRGRRGMPTMPSMGRSEMPSRDVNLRVAGPVVPGGSSASDAALARAMALRNRREV